ncbi:MAG: 5'/3'-nucleotidase SurE [Acidobacteriota bacterium]
MILLTNDDGFLSKGLAELHKKISRLDKVLIVAPQKQKSAVSFSLTLHRPLRLQKFKKNFFILDGTPTDCVNFALMKICEEKPILIISGINKGPNLGEDVLFSGTVSAAVQGTLFGIYSLAVSSIPDEKGNYRFDEAADISIRISKWALKNGLPDNTTLSINIPPSPKGIRITSLGNKRYFPQIIERTDPRGASYYWIGEGKAESAGDENTDVGAIREGYISVTPIHLDLTDYKAIELLKSKNLERIFKKKNENY